MGSMPCNLSCLTTSGDFNAAWIAPLSLSTTSRGVRAGATTPCQAAASSGGPPLSPKVGTSGNCSERSYAGTAMARSLPASINGRAAARSAIISGTTPAATSCKAGGVPL
ncbi:Uncharacterised protein [Achromobacter xylosoxidans]|nr:Uncharacterised protein [Achromobacter xylosoxidans]CUJ47649.1 Uncharacterised protein [Achromobacter xylosoxidans]CUK02053.1 Uncharacterised protein [Achromobacter xylosoxidans]